MHGTRVAHPSEYAPIGLMLPPMLSGTRHPNLGMLPCPLLCEHAVPSVVGEKTKGDTVQLQFDIGHHIQ